MRLKSINVTDLFGLFNHYIPLNSDERITIIHGPNGYGKTAVLRLISDVFTARHTAIRELPFSKLELELSDSRTLVVSKESSTADADVSRIVYSCAQNEPFELGHNWHLDAHISSIDRYVPGLSRMAPDEWYWNTTGETLGIDEVIERFADRLPDNISMVPYPKWLADIRDSLDVHFIKANRLDSGRETARPYRRRKRKNAMSVVVNYSEEITEHINRTLAKYAELSQSLDRSFPQRLVTSGGSPAMSMETIRARLSDLETKRKRLTDAGLLDKEEEAHFNPAALDDTKAEVLTLYISDVERKLAEFDNLYARIDLLKTILNRRFSFKTVSVSKSDGIEFFSESGGPLAPNFLSSGEQHEVVLLYQLLFRVKANALILIDEPELSLHIAWQEQFLEDLEQVTAISSFDVLVATHSPQIISGRWDLTVALKGPEECSTTSRTTASRTP